MDKILKVVTIIFVIMITRDMFAFENGSSIADAKDAFNTAIHAKDYSDLYRKMSAVAKALDPDKQRGLELVASFVYARVDFYKDGNKLRGEPELLFYSILEGKTPREMIVTLAAMMLSESMGAESVLKDQPSTHERKLAQRYYDEIRAKACMLLEIYGSTR